MLQQFLGFANFYRRFIRNFSTVAAPLTTMTKHSTSHLTWSPEALLAFQELKTRFTSAPILHHPDPSIPFEVDTSNTGIGAVLSQRQGNPAKMFPCAFYSRKLSSVEPNYDVGNRELLAMKAALEEWCHWLEGAKHPFTVLTDHKNVYLQNINILPNDWILGKQVGQCSLQDSISQSLTAQAPRISRPMLYPDRQIKLTALRSRRTLLLRLCSLHQYNGISWQKLIKWIGRLLLHRIAHLNSLTFLKLSEINSCIRCTTPPAQVTLV